jgi:1-acyl-sn-glycerol-3-phosphate acyltransferase
VEQLGVTAVYSVGSRLFELGFRALGLRRRLVGGEHLPRTGPGILASNHVGYLDFSFVMLAPPRPRREVRFLARAEFFDQPVTGFLLRRLDQIPVEVHGDATTAIATATERLRTGELVGLHPEGTISPSFVTRRARSGAIRLADATGAPIVPCAVWGSQRLLTKGRPPSPTRGVAIEVRYGEPFHPQAATVHGRTQELMDRIDGLLADAQRAYPQRPGPYPDDWWQPAHLGGSAPTPEQAEARIRAQNAQRRTAAAQRARRGGRPEDRRDPGNERGSGPRGTDRSLDGRPRSAGR